MLHQPRCDNSSSSRHSKHPSALGTGESIPLYPPRGFLRHNFLFSQALLFYCAFSFPFRLRSLLPGLFIVPSNFTRPLYPLTRFTRTLCTYRKPIGLNGQRDNRLNYTLVAGEMACLADFIGFDRICTVHGETTTIATYRL